MNRRILLPVIAVILGISLGLSTSYMSNAEVREDRRYCMEVEEGIQQSMDEGIVNCVTGQNIKLNLSSSLGRELDLRCICRKKVNGVVETLRITN